MQAEGVDGECVGDVESLLLVTHVGAADGCLPQIEAGVLHRKMTRARADTDVQIMQAEFLCVIGKGKLDSQFFRCQSKLTAVDTT